MNATDITLELSNKARVKVLVKWEPLVELGAAHFTVDNQEVMR